MKDTNHGFVIKDMRNQAISKTVIAVTVFAVAVAAGLYFSSKKGGLPVAMEAYENSVYGVAFDYPKTYDLTETSKSDKEGGPGLVVTLVEKGIKIPTNGEGPTAITVAMYDNSVTKNTKQDPALSWIINSTSSNFNLSRQSKPGETNIGDKKAYLYTWDGLYQGTSVVTEHNGNIIMFSVTYDGETDLKKREDFTKMMQTVRFHTATPTGTTTSRQGSDI